MASRLFDVSVRQGTLCSCNGNATSSPGDNGLRYSTAEPLHVFPFSRYDSRGSFMKTVVSLCTCAVLQTAAVQEPSCTPTKSTMVPLWCSALYVTALERSTSSDANESMRQLRSKYDIHRCILYGLPPSPEHDKIYMVRMKIIQYASPYH